jgi:hypothetical protein
MSNIGYLTYTVSQDSWDPDELGNHRAVITVDRQTDVVRIRISWRRRDTDPQEKGALLYSERGTKVENYLPVTITQAYGDFLFEPVDGPGRYFLYFMPYAGDVKVPYPNAEYLPAYIVDTRWRTVARAFRTEDVIEAEVTHLESVDEFNRFTEMELIADDDELVSLYALHSDESYILFPEYRRAPIRMFGAVPRCWAADGPRSGIEEQAHRGESYVFQIGLHAHRKSLQEVSVQFGDLADKDGRLAASAGDMTCFNTGGRSWDGSVLNFQVSVDEGRVQPLWCAIDISDIAIPGDYSARVSVTADGETQSFPLKIEIVDKSLPHHGYDDSDRLARLCWLDSDIGNDDEVVPPYTPVKITGNRIGILGRELAIADTGLPEQITSFFSDDLNSISEVPLNLFAAPMTFEVLLADGKILRLTPDSMEFVESGDSYTKWQVVSRAELLVLTIEAALEFDGTIEYSLRLVASEDVEVMDIRLTATFQERVARLMTGLGRKGGAIPDRYDWKWDVKRNQDSVWIGSVNAGVQFTFKDKHYSRPLNTNFYQMKPLVMPDSWYNRNNGTISLEKLDGVYRLTSSSGSRNFFAGDVLDFDMRLLITPFKTIDTKEHFQTRYFHKYESIDKVRAHGANTINIHHATDINPYINYPFLTPELMKAYIDEAHEKDCRVKLYYTTRELTTRTPEFFALKSLGHEIFVNGKRGGHAWLHEHVDEGYLSAWYALEVRDTSAINGVVSRWHNFYVEGMNWLAENLNVDGLYIDDIGFGREIMKRVRRVLHHHRSKPVIDFHSANQYNERDGFASSTNLYMEHFPFLDRLWFGEYFDYDETPDYWLLEISGVPFGLLGEMLQDGGNPWRGMLFGMTGRMPRVQNEALWKMWDAYGLGNARMVGFWSETCPVSNLPRDIKSTIYIGREYSIIALASWADEETRVHIDVDWDKAGEDRAVTRIFVPAIDGFQEGNDSLESGGVVIEPGKGKLVVLAH